MFLSYFSCLSERIRNNFIW